MKLIIAVVKPFKAEAVMDALSASGIEGLTVTEVRGYGRQKGHTEIYRGAEYEVNLLPKVQITVAVDDPAVRSVTETIETAARTGAIGDGKIFVLPLDHVTRIRTGETGAQAL
jgi:nitrogen regulatory protein P-II 2